MINIMISGCNGKMGKVISGLAMETEDIKVIAGFDVNAQTQSSFPIYKKLTDCIEKPDVIIDFSNPSAFEDVLSFAVSKNIALVMATTGLSESDVAKMKESSKRIPIFYSANMSLGVNLLLDLVIKAAKVLEDSFDIEIIEKHHNQKLDAPSGTALAIADTINKALDEKYEYIYDRHSRRKKRSKNEIGIHAIRGGSIVGEHSVIFAGKDEIIEINHIASSKEIFGVGALKAARFLTGKKSGFYNMKNLLDSE